MNIKTIKPLPTEFFGKGEVKGFHFDMVQADINNGVYLYKVMTEHHHSYYEIFKSKEYPMLVDWDKREYSKTKFKHTYQKANKFGISAFTTHDLEKAKEYFYGFLK